MDNIETGNGNGNVNEAAAAQGAGNPAPGVAPGVHDGPTNFSNLGSGVLYVPAVPIPPQDMNRAVAENPFRLGVENPPLPPPPQAPGFGGQNPPPPPPPQVTRVKIPIPKGIKFIGESGPDIYYDEIPDIKTIGQKAKKSNPLVQPAGDVHDVPPQGAAAENPPHPHRPLKPLIPPLLGPGFGESDAKVEELQPYLGKVYQALFCDHPIPEMPDNAPPSPQSPPQPPTKRAKSSSP